MTVAVAGPVAAGATSYDVSATASPQTVAPRQAYDVVGTVSPAVAGATMMLQQLQLGRWRTIASQAANGSGGFDFRQTAPRGVGMLRLRVTTTLGATSPTVVVYSTVTGYRVTVDGPSIADPDVPFALNGEVSPPAPGQPVALEELLGGAWLPVTTAVLTPQSTFDFTATATSLGQHDYRVVKAASAFRLAGVGRMSVTAARWHFLSDVSPADGGADGSDVTVWDQPFPHSIVWTWLTSGSNTEHVTFDLGGQCLLFRATAGVDDASSYFADVVANLGVSLDGRTAFSRAMEVSDREDLVLDVTGVHTLSLDLTQIPASDGTVALVSAGFGDAQVLCTF